MRVTLVAESALTAGMNGSFVSEAAWQANVRRLAVAIAAGNRFRKCVRAKIFLVGVVPGVAARRARRSGKVARENV